MSYLNYQGKKVQMNHKYLIGAALAPVPDKIDLMSSYGVNFSSLPVVTGNQTVLARMYIQSTSTTFSLVWSNGSTQDYIRMDYGTGEYGSTFMVENRNSPSLVRKVYNLANEGVLGVPFSLEIIKSTGNISSVKFNGVEGTDLVGFLGFGPTNLSYFRGSNHASIWNLEIVGTHKWIGFPNGNTTPAWVDTIGSINGTISGTPGTINLTT